MLKETTYVCYTAMDGRKFWDKKEALEHDSGLSFELHFANRFPHLEFKDPTVSFWRIRSLRKGSELVRSGGGFAGGEVTEEYVDCWCLDGEELVQGTVADIYRYLHNNARYVEKIIDSYGRGYETVQIDKHIIKSLGV